MEKQRSDCGVSDVADDALGGGKDKAGARVGGGKAGQGFKAKGEIKATGAKKNASVGMEAGCGERCALGEAGALSGEKKTFVGKKRPAGKTSAPAGKKTVQAVNKDVERALLRKAVGYTYTQQESYKVKYIEYEEGTGKKKFERESVEVVEVEKYVPPEYSAIALWLKARMPRVWGDAAQETAGEPVVIVDDIPAQLGAGDGVAVNAE